jgi:hypothetical protein
VIISSLHEVSQVSQAGPGEPRTLRLTDGQTVHAGHVILACGADYRRLQATNADRFEGSGLYYAATHTEALQVSGTATSSPAKTRVITQTSPPTGTERTEHPCSWSRPSAMCSPLATFAPAPPNASPQPSETARWSPAPSTTRCLHHVAPSAAG